MYVFVWVWVGVGVFCAVCVRERERERGRESGWVSVSGWVGARAHVNGFLSLSRSFVCRDILSLSIYLPPHTHTHTPRARQIQVGTLFVEGVEPADGDGGSNSDSGTLGAEVR